MRAQLARSGREPQPINQLTLPRVQDPGTTESQLRERDEIGRLLASAEIGRGWDRTSDLPRVNADQPEFFALKRG